MATESYYRKCKCGKLMVIHLDGLGMLAHLGCLLLFDGVLVRSVNNSARRIKTVICAGCITERRFSKFIRVKE